jgi:hypothetical protein
MSDALARQAQARATRSKPVALPTPTPGAERRVVSHIGLISALKVSIAFYLGTVVVGVVALFSLWLVAQAFGIVGNLEDFVADLLAYEEFSFVSWELFRAATVVGIVWATLATTLTMIAVAFYNVFAELLGGVEITLADEDGDDS